MAFDLNHGADQRQILDAASDMLSASFPLDRLRQTQRDSLAPIAEFGLFGLSLGADADFSLVEETLVHVLLGRHLVSTRALATSIGVAVATESAEPTLAAGLSSGAREACFALSSGDRLLVIDREASDLAIVFTGRRVDLIDIGGVERHHETGLGDGFAVERFDAARCSVLASTESPRVLYVADTLVSAQLLGIAEAARDLATDYARLRHQFGKPIGAFQAIKHHCANMAIEAEMLSAQLDMAAIAVRDQWSDAGFQVAALRRLAGRAALANARTCIQIHGGIGFSAEVSAHLFLKQAHVLSRLGTTEPFLSLPAPMAPHSHPRS